MENEFRRWMRLVEMPANMASAAFYHGTDLPSLVLMLREDRIRPQSFGGPDGVSLTTDFDTAESFAGRATARWISLREDHDLDFATDLPPGFGYPSDDGVVLILSAETLRADNHSLDHYHDDDTFFDEDEFEVRAGSKDGIAPLSRYLTGFTCRAKDLVWFARFCEAAPPHTDLYGLTENDYKAFLRHPLRREP